MKYVIKTPYETIEFKRLDFALNALLQHSYKCLAADGQLDTKAGHNFYNGVKKYINTQSYKQNRMIAELPNGQLLTFNTVIEKD